MQERKVYHVELKDPRVGEQKHSYFGSIKGIFSAFTKERLGISYLGIVNNYDLQKAPYENKHCIIRYGILQTMRKKPSKSDRYDRERKT